MNRGRERALLRTVAGAVVITLAVLMAWREASTSAGVLVLLGASVHPAVRAVWESAREARAEDRNPLAALRRLDDHRRAP